MKYRVIEIKKGDDQWYEIEYSFSIFWLFAIWQPLDTYEFENEPTKNGYPYKFNTEEEATKKIHALHEKRKVLITIQF